MKKKKIILILVVLFVIIGGYLLKSTVETKAVAEIQKSLDDAGIKYESVSYELFKNRLELTQLSSVERSENELFTVMVERLVVHDFNRKIMFEEEPYADLFGNLLAQNIIFDYKNSQSLETWTFTTKSYEIKEYKHNLINLQKEAEIDNTSKAFYQALLSFAHQGVVLDDIALSYINNGQVLLKTSIDNFIIEQENDYNISSYLIEKLDFVAEDIKFNTKKVELVDLLYPDLENLASMLSIISKEDIDSNNFDAHLLALFDKTFSYTHAKPFDKFAITATSLNLDNEYLGNFDLNFAYSETVLDYIEEKDERKARVASKLNDFNYMSNFSEFNNPLLTKLVDAFKFEKVNFSSDTKTEIDLTTGKMSISSASNLTQLFNGEFEMNMLYKAAEFWLFCMSGAPNFTSVLYDDYTPFLDLVEYKDFSLDYKDQGLIPMFVAYNALNSSITMEQSVQNLLSEINSLNAFAMFGGEKIATIANKTANALKEQISNPGTLDIYFDLNAYTSFDNFLSHLLSQKFDFKYSIESKTGKSVLDQIPASL